MQAVVCKKMYVLAFAREAGGAEAIAPVLRLTQRSGSPCIVCSKGAGVTVFKNYGFDAEPIDGFSDLEIESVLSSHWGEGIYPGVLLTSASSLPSVDMTEKKAWHWAERHSIKSIAVLDQWQNYEIRFSGQHENERLAYMPDVCCVMDSVARDGMIRDGFPEERIVITGQPAFDSLLEFGADFSRDDQAALRKSLHVEQGRDIVMFCSEALSGDIGSVYGYNEKRVLATLLEILSALPDSVHLLVKLHPQNVYSDLSDVIEEYGGGLPISIIKPGLSAWPFLMISDLIAGMSSILLVESVLLRRKTVSLQLNAKMTDKCHAVNVGSLPLIVDAEQARCTILSLLSDEGFCEQWLQMQSSLSLENGAAERVYRLMEKTASLANLDIHMDGR